MDLNLNITTARDVLELISILKAKAKAERGIELHTEVKIIGEEIL
jgi:UDP-N-acetylmuramate dehydrogenase